MDHTIRPIINRLRDKYAQLIEKSEIDRAINEPGRLRISTDGSYARYYQCLPNEDPKGIYLTKDKRHVASALAQKRYGYQINAAAKQCLKQINKTLNMLKTNPIESIYDNYKPARQELVTPYIITDKDFINEWLSEKYVGNEFYSEENTVPTDSGIMVKSKSEAMIANYLSFSNIPFKYEHPLYLDGIGTIYPDFTLLDINQRKEAYYEHFGIMDDEIYAEKTIRKINAYVQNGYIPGENFLFSFETKRRLLDIRYVKKIITSWASQ